MAPIGYTISGWYGAPMSVPVSPPPGSSLPVPQTGSDDEQLRERALSESDVLIVLALVQAEYQVDPDRVYLMGH